jgi:hypothetical protein
MWAALSPDASSVYFGTQEGFFYSVDTATGATRVLLKNTVSRDTPFGIFAIFWLPKLAGAQSQGGRPEEPAINVKH